MQVVHSLLEIRRADLVGVGRFALADGMEHDHHDNCAGRGVRGCPLVFYVLAGILNVCVRRIQWVELTRDKC